LVHFDLNQISCSQTGFASCGQDPLHPPRRKFVELGDVATRPDDFCAVRLVELLELVAVVLFQFALFDRPIQNVDLSRIYAAPSARLSHFPLEGDGAFPAHC